MPEIEELVDPQTTVVLCHEMQRGIVGDLALPNTAPAVAVAEAGTVPACSRLFATARAAGIRILHCGAAYRKDYVGSFRNTPLLANTISTPPVLIEGTPSVNPVQDIWEPDTDVVLLRFHGMTSFAGTELDWLLKSLHASTVVITGVSVNRGVTGLTIEAVNYGYRVVIPTDCVIGYPKEYSDMVLEHTLAALAWLATGDDLVSVWEHRLADIR
jgi:biuret amidohydrolase